MSLLNFPNEILLEISKDLDFLSSFSLLQAHSHFHLLLTPRVLDFANANEGHGMTALYLAAAYNDEKLIRLLLEKGPHVAIIDGEKALESNIEGFDLDHAVKLLLEQGAKSEIWNCNCNTSLLLWALKSWQEDILHLILKHGINVNMRRREGAPTALHKAVQFHDDHSRPAVMLLLKHGADVNCVDHFKWTPLHHAANGSGKEIISALVEYGADRSMKDIKGLTALDLLRGNEPASWVNYKTMVKLLDPSKNLDSCLDSGANGGTESRYASGLAGRPASFHTSVDMGEQRGFSPQGLPKLVSKFTR